MPANQAGDIFGASSPRVSNGAAPPDSVQWRFGNDSSATTTGRGASSWPMAQTTRPCRGAGSTDRLQPERAGSFRSAARGVLRPGAVQPSLVSPAEGAGGVCPEGCRRGMDEACPGHGAVRPWRGAVLSLPCFAVSSPPCIPLSFRVVAVSFVLLCGCVLCCRSCHALLFLSGTEQHWACLLLCQPAVSTRCCAPSVARSFSRGVRSPFTRTALLLCGVPTPAPAAVLCVSCSVCASQQPVPCRVPFVPFGLCLFLLTFRAFQLFPVCFSNSVPFRWVSFPQSKGAVSLHETRSGREWKAMETGFPHRRGVWSRPPKHCSVESKT